MLIRGKELIMDGRRAVGLKYADEEGNLHSSPAVASMTESANCTGLRVEFSCSLRLMVLESAAFIMRCGCGAGVSAQGGGQAVNWSVHLCDFFRFLMR